MRGDWSCIHCKHEGARGNGETEERYCRHDSIPPGDGVLPKSGVTPDWCPIANFRDGQYRRYQEALLQIESIPSRMHCGVDAANEAVRLAKEAFIPPMRKI